MIINYRHEFIAAYEELDKSVRRPIWKKLEEMHRTQLSQFQHQALKGEQFKGLFKLRVGDWRLIYQMAEGGVLFLTLGHRSEVYE